MSQMTLAQLVSRMPPELAVAYRQFGAALAELAASPSMREGCTLPCALFSVSPSGSVLRISVPGQHKRTSIPIREVAPPLLGSAPVSRSIHDEREVDLTTRWGIM